MKEIAPDNKGIGQVSSKSRENDAKSRNSGSSELTGEFSRILSTQLEDCGLTGEEAQALPELSATYSAQLAGLSQDQGLISGQISGSIDLLEQYAAMLSDPESTLKEAYDLLEKIQLQTLEINQGLTDTQASDPMLANILNHISTVVELEKIKINRGDYT